MALPQIVLTGNLVDDPELRACSVESCGNPVRSWTWCRKHYRRWLKWGDPLVRFERDLRSADERFEAELRRQSNGCLHWAAGRISTGYGLFYPTTSDNPVLAHRYAFERAYRPLLPGEEVDHTCHNADPTCLGGRGCLHRRCCEPTHLDAVDGDTNLRRSHRWNGNKTHCPVGHEYTPENTYVQPSKPNGRRCRECARIRDRERGPLRRLRRKEIAA